jgi:hypothetical protein
MNRRLLILVFALVLLLAALFLWLFSGRIARRTVEQRTSAALGLETTVEEMELPIFRGNTTLSGLKVRNPPGFEAEHFLTLGDGKLSLTFWQLLGRRVEVPLLVLSRIDLELERRLTEANYSRVVESFRRQKREAAPGEAPGRRFFFREVLLQDVTVHVRFLPEIGEPAEATVKIPAIRLEDVGRNGEEGLAVGQVAAALVRALLEAAARAGAPGLPRAVLEEIEGARDRLEALGAEGVELLGEVESRVEEATEELQRARRRIEREGERVLERARGLLDEAGRPKEGPER